MEKNRNGYASTELDDNYIIAPADRYAILKATKDRNDFTGDWILRKALGADNRDFNVITLANVGDFVKIIGDNNRIYYGGDQLWHGKNTLGHNGGCGTIAVANILTYLAKKDPQNKNLYSNQLENISKLDFTNYIKEVYEFVTPQEIKLPFLNPILIGKPLSSKLQRQTKRFAFNKGINLKTNSCNNIFKGINSRVDFIRNSLENDNPVAMLVWFNKRLNNIKYFRADGEGKDQNFQLHWVTITGLSENKKTGDNYVLVSSWGGKAFIKLNDVYSGGPMFLVNFESNNF